MVTRFTKLVPVPSGFAHSMGRENRYQFTQVHAHFDLFTRQSDYCFTRTRNRKYMTVDKNWCKSEVFVCFYFKYVSQISSYHQRFGARTGYHHIILPTPVELYTDYIATEIQSTHIWLRTLAMAIPSLSSSALLCGTSRLKVSNWNLYKILNREILRRYKQICQKDCYIPRSTDRPIKCIPIILFWFATGINDCVQSFANNIKLHVSVLNGVLVHTLLSAFPHYFQWGIN